MFSECFNFNDSLIDADDISGVTNSEQALYYGGWNLRSHSTGFRDVKVFKALVPQTGAYRVDIHIGSAHNAIRDMKVFAGRRNMVLSVINVAMGESYDAHFITYVSEYYPAMSHVIYDEKAVYVSITGENANIDTIQISKVDVPTVFVAGDSTLTDQNAPIPYYPLYSCCGWAQLLGLFFSDVAINNQAHSGMTTNCFRDDGHWDIVKSQIRKGDMFLLQFGHNDQKRRNLAAFGGYIDNIRWYVNEVRKLGAFPVIVSPISRIPFSDRGQYRSLLTQHALACRQAALEMDVPFIDLHEITFKFLCENIDKASDFFIKGDITHTNEYGAVRFAQFVADEVKRLEIKPLSDMAYERPATVFDGFDREEMPAEPIGNGTLDIPMPYVDVTADMAQYGAIEDALKNWLLDPCVMHLHPDAPMPRAQFLMVYFKAIKKNGTRPYLGKYCDMSRYEWDSGYVQTCIDEGLIDEETVPDERFRPNDALTVGEFASFAIRGIKPQKHDRDISVGKCMDDAVELGIIDSMSDSGSIISRAECYAGLVKVMEILGNAELGLPSDAEVHPVG